MVNDISTYRSLAKTDPAFDPFVSAVEQLFTRSMNENLLDDRFDEQWRREIISHDSYRAVLCTNADQPIGLLEHWKTDAGEIRLEFLLDQRFTADQPTSGVESTSSALLRDLVSALLTASGGHGVVSNAPVEVWARPTSLSVERLMTTLGAELSRHLFQMRTTSPAIETNADDPSTDFALADRDDLIEVNNLAFVNHPDQGTMTVERFERLAAEPWFSPEGIRLHKLDGRITAFCWTKIHDKPSIGEIYVVGVSPLHQGKGLGKLITTAGIHWLHRQGQDEVMLYVEANNASAVAVYERLGFSTVRTDKAWKLPSLNELANVEPTSESLQ